MSAIPGRKVRIKYSTTEAGTFGVVAKAISDSATINNEPIDISSKDDGGVRTLLDDVGTKSVDLSVSGIITDAIFIELALNAGEGSSLHWFELEIAGIGTIKARYFITNYNPGGNNGADGATFECSLQSSGAIVWTAA